MLKKYKKNKNKSIQNFHNIDYTNLINHKNKTEKLNNFDNCINIKNEDNSIDINNNINIINDNINFLSGKNINKNIFVKYIKENDNFMNRNNLYYFSSFIIIIF